MFYVTMVITKIYKILINFAMLRGSLEMRLLY